jgi:hypothetical protein
MPGSPRPESRVVREPVAELRDLIEMWIEDSDGLRNRPGRGSRRSPLSAVTRDRRDLRDGEPPAA